MINTIGRALPDTIEGYGPVRPFAGAAAGPPEARRHAPPLKPARPGQRKLLGSLAALFARLPLRDGMTFSFHHHLRNGDAVVNLVLAAAARHGLRDLTVALSSIFPVHAPLVAHIASGVVAGLDCAYMSGPVATAVSHGALPRPAILRTHGGRVHAIERGRLHIDVAFIAAPAADDEGNLSGRLGPSACGALGYAVADAEYADWVVALTDHLVPYPLAPIAIPQIRVDFVVPVASIGDPAGIVSGTTRVTDDPQRLAMAALAAQVIDAAGLIRDGFAYQTGAGGTSLAVTRFVRQMLAERGVVGGFALGGITGDLVEMLEAGLFQRLLDVQCFDLAAVRSLASNPNHVEIGAGHYASPANSGCAVNRLDCVILGATEIDTAFHTNVTTGSDGIIRGGSGGHSDAAAGAGLAIIVASSRRGALPIVVDRVLTATTPGETVDVLVCEAGVAVNPRRPELAARLAAAGLPLRDIAELRDSAAVGGAPEPPALGARIVAAVEYRDGTLIDVVRQVSGPVAPSATSP